MATWAEDNFGNDGARDYLAVLIAKLVATVNDVLADPDRTAPDEDGESLLMPSVEVLALLCERYAAAPPKPTTVEQWRDKYLDAFDRRIDKLKPKPGFKTARRKVLVKTFRWLEGVAEAYYST
jgi:hypothetical protein